MHREGPPWRHGRSVHPRVIGGYRITTPTDELPAASSASSGYPITLTSDPRPACFDRSGGVDADELAPEVVVGLRQVLPLGCRPARHTAAVQGDAVVWPAREVEERRRHAHYEEGGRVQHSVRRGRKDGDVLHEAFACPKLNLEPDGEGGTLDPPTASYCAPSPKAAYRLPAASNLSWPAAMQAWRQGETHA